jgi:hypothetical protein
MIEQLSHTSAVPLKVAMPSNMNNRMHCCLLPQIAARTQLPCKPSVAVLVLYSCTNWTTSAVRPVRPVQYTIPYNSKSSITERRQLVINVSVLLPVRPVS